MAQEVVYGFLSTNLIFLTFPKICKDTNHVNQDEVVLHKSALSWMCFNCLELLCISGACLGKEILSPRKQPQCPGALSAVDAFIWALPNNADLLPYCHAALWLLSSVSSSDMSFSTSPPLGNLHLQSFFSGCIPEFIPFQYFLSIHQWAMRVILPLPWVQGVFNSSDWMGTSTLGFQFGWGACFEVNLQAVPI